MGMISIPVTSDTKWRRRKRKSEREREADQTTVRFSQTWLGTKLGRWPCESPGFVLFSACTSIKDPSSDHC